MSLEPFIAFFLVRYLRNSLKLFPADEKWQRIFTVALFAIAGFFILDLATSWDTITDWIWYAAVILIIWIVYKFPEFSHAIPTVNAVMPLVLLNILIEVVKLVNKSFYNRAENYFDLALCVAVTWMIAALVRSGKQKKALEKEREKTREEAERSRFIAAQKKELEVLVNERTAELLQQKEDLQHALSELRETQSQLIQSEKMASLGELTAGIAHEIQNPLNFVNNFSEVNAELIEELKTELIKTNGERDIELEKELLTDISQNLEKINFHGKRADAIVKGMLQHSRTSTGQKEPTDLNALADEYLRLSYHGLRAKDKSFNATMITEFDDSIQKVKLVAQDIGRVLLNLFNNAFYAVNEKKKSMDENYKPTVTVKTKNTGAEILVTVSDNGNGIPQKVIDKIFQPFFTTKPTGEGTGLGLSLSYDIIKAHGGTLEVETEEGKFSTFIVSLPAS